MGDAANKKPNPDFLIRLVGPDLKPWAVPMRALTRILAAVQRLVDQRDELADVDESEVPVSPVLGEIRTLRLLSVTSGSASYGVSSIDPEPTLSILRGTGRALESPEISQWRPSTI